MSKKVVKQYYLGEDTLELLEVLGPNRSMQITASVANAYDNPATLAEALELRLKKNRVEAEAALARAKNTTHVGASLNVETVTRLASLSVRCGLPTEHVLRLAIEAYAKARGRSDGLSTKESNEATPHLPAVQHRPPDT